MSEQVAILRLMQTRGLGPRTLAQTLARLAQEGRSAADLAGAPEDELIHRYGLKPEIARALKSGQRQAEQVSEELERQGIRVLVRGTAGYPIRLTQTLGADAPPVLFLAANDALLKRKAVAFSGARDASEQGLQLTKHLASLLAQHGVNVVSGHANGVDLTAHCAALSAGGTTALVLAEGILRFRGKPGLAELLTEDNSVVLSEFAPRQTWSVGNAMQRNRTICGLADAVLIVEAGETGGTFAAGQTTLERNQPLFVVAYPDPPASAKGNVLLIQQGGLALPCRPGSDPDLTPILRLLQQRTENGPRLPAEGTLHAEPVQRQLF